MAKKKSTNGAPSASVTAESVNPAAPPSQEEKDFLDAHRREVIQIASCESLDWLSILQALSESATLDLQTLARRLPDILSRLSELSSIALSAIDDPSHETAALRQSLRRCVAT